MLGQATGTLDHKTHHGPDSGEATTFPHIIFFATLRSIPWNPATSSNKPLIGDWVSKKEADQIAPPEWVYQIIDTNLTTASAKEFRKSSSAGRVQATSSHRTTIPFEGYEPVRILAQDGHGTTLRLAKDLLPPGKKPPIYWIFESGFISGLPWDPGDWLW